MYHFRQWECVKHWISVKSRFPIHSPFPAPFYPFPFILQAMPTPNADALNIPITPPQTKPFSRKTIVFYEVLFFFRSSTLLSSFYFYSSVPISIQVTMTFVDVLNIIGYVLIAALILYVFWIPPSPLFPAYSLLYSACTAWSGSWFPATELVSISNSLFPASSILTYS